MNDQCFVVVDNFFAAKTAYGTKNTSSSTLFNGLYSFFSLAVICDHFY